MAAVDHDLSRVFEIHRDPIADDRLDLPQSPIVPLGVQHQHSRLQKRSHLQPPGSFMTDQADLAALIASRICHDLISPIGAISNGVELLEMEIADRPELALLSESAGNANARIRFFRISFGAASPDQRIARSEVLSVLAGLAAGNRITTSWTSAPDLARREVRLAFLVLQCLETALPYGGKVTIREEDASWAIQAEAPRLKLDQPLWNILRGSPAPAGLAANAVQFALVPTALAALGRKLAVTTGETSISLTF